MALIPSVAPVSNERIDARVDVSFDARYVLEDDILVGDENGDPVRQSLTTSVAAALALDSTPAAAAAAAAETAIDNEIIGRDLLEGATIVEEEEVIFAVVDEDGRRTWIEAAPDGGMTAHAISKISEDITVGVDMSEATDLAFAVVDEDGKRTELEIGLDGKFTQRVVDSIAARLTGGSSLASWVICSGDSMTGGSSGDPYPLQLQALEPGWDVRNLGAGGESSTTIAGRMGGRPMLVTVSGSEIPTSGGVTVTLDSDDGEHTPTPLLQQDAGTNPVEIAGVRGTLSEASGTYTFTRADSGDAVPAVGLFPLVTYAMRTYRTGIHVLWWGTNDVNADSAHVIRRIRALTEWLTDPVPRYLVIAPTAGAMRVENPDFLQEFGRRFIDALTFLQSDAAFTISGVTKTGTDTTDIAAGNVPTSFRADATHLNTTGNGLVAALVRDRIEEMGWL